MKKIIRGRGKGKTTELIKLSAERGAPIICMTALSARTVNSIAGHMGYKIPLAIACSEYKRGSYKSVLVDDAEYVLEGLLGSAVEALSMNMQKVITKNEIAEAFGMNPDDFIIEDN